MSRRRCRAPQTPQTAYRKLPDSPPTLGTVSTTTTPEARLLVVEDEPNIRELLATSLRFAGFEVHVAGDGATEIVIEPDERNLAWLRVDQSGKASADAYPDQVFDARITYIAPAVDRQRGSIEVRLAVPEPPATLRPDMTVSVDLTVASANNVFTLPSDSIRDAATAAPNDNRGSASTHRSHPAADASAPFPALRRGRRASLRTAMGPAGRA